MVMFFCKEVLFAVVLWKSIPLWTTCLENIKIIKQDYKLIWMLEVDWFTIMISNAKICSSRVCRALSFSFCSTFYTDTTMEQVNLNYWITQTYHYRVKRHTGRIWCMNWKVLFKRLDGRHSSLKRKPNPQIK